MLVFSSVLRGGGSGALRGPILNGYKWSCQPTLWLMLAKRLTNIFIGTKPSSGFGEGVDVERIDRPVYQVLQQRHWYSVLSVVGVYISQSSIFKFELAIYLFSCCLCFFVCTPMKMKPTFVKWDAEKYFFLVESINHRRIWSRGLVWAIVVWGVKEGRKGFLDGRSIKLNEVTCWGYETW